MDFSLLISAQTLRLSPNLKRGQTDDGLWVVKNIPAKTYLRVTTDQWKILSLFEEPRIVPSVLDRAIKERLCVPLGEFYELILKATRAGVLLEPDSQPILVEASDWRGSLSPAVLRRPLGALFLGGLVLSLGFRPELPATLIDAAAGIGILIATLSLGAYVTGCLIRGAGGEVYRPRWQWLAIPPCFRIDASDAILLPSKLQDAVAVAEPAVLAAAAGLTTWYQPAWSFFPLLGLIINIRPFLGGRFADLVRLGHERHESDAEHSFIFPPNRGPKARWRLLRRGLRQTNTWVRVCYAIVWGLAVIYLAARFTDTPPWTFEFWETNGLRIAVAVVGSLALLGLVYLVWESYHFVRTRGQAWGYAFRQWRKRWFSGTSALLDEAKRIEAIAGSSLLRLLDVNQRQTLARAMEPSSYGPWRSLAAYEGENPPRIALIVTGRVAVHREVAGGKNVLVQVLGPGDVIGLHDMADPNRPHFRLRTKTPVTLLTVDRALTTALLMDRVTISPFGNMLLKVPFLRGISLCKNWHLQAVERFALLSTVTEYPDGHVIFDEGQMVDRFFIILEGDAVVTQGKRQLAVVRPGEFFGEIGLMQNSSANAAITARRNLRSLGIARAEFIRFVTHNYSVALELERVSSERLGRPIFPVRQSDFRVK